MIKTADKNIKIHSVPLPSISYENSVLTVEFDDVHEKRKKVSFYPVQALRMTTADCFDYSMVTVNDGSCGISCNKFILENNDSDWLRALNADVKFSDENDFMEKSRHFIIDLRDDVLEVAAWNIEIHKMMSVSAHRGFSSKYPENTMEAFKAAIEAGVDEIETDVRVTADGELVLIHDDTVDRTTDGQGKVCEMTLAELKKLDAGVKKSEMFAGARVPTLRELLELARDSGNITLDIELKEYPDEGREELAYDVCDRALAMIDEYGFTGRCVINSWNGKLNEYVRGKYGDKYRQHVYYPEKLLGKCTVDPYSYAYCACLFTNDHEAYEYLRLRGVEPWVGASVKDEESLDKAIENGACLVTCNNVDDILALLRRKGMHK